MGKDIYCPDCGGFLQKIDTGYPQGLDIKMECIRCRSKWEIKINWAYYSDGITSITRIG